MSIPSAVDILPAADTSAIRVPRFVVSLDFELMWGVRDDWSIKRYGANILGARAAIPRLLTLFREYDVKATWATVGMLLFDDKKDLLDALPELRPSYTSPGLGPYTHLDSVGANERSDPLHFGLSLARTIADCEGMELGSHSFSHYYALEPGQTREQFAADIEASARTIAGVAGHPKSFVFPRNQVNPDYFDICRRAGFESFRGTEGGWIYRAGDRRSNSRVKRAGRLVDAYLSLTGSNTAEPRRRDGMIDVPSSRFLRPYSSLVRPFERLRIRRITSAMETAAQTNTTFHLWWHPHNFGVATDKNLEMLRVILDCYRDLSHRYGMRSQTMTEAAREACGQ